MWVPVHCTHTQDTPVTSVSNQNSQKYHFTKYVKFNVELLQILDATHDKTSKCFTKCTILRNAVPDFVTYITT